MNKKGKSMDWNKIIPPSLSIFMFYTVLLGVEAFLCVSIFLEKYSIVKSYILRVHIGRCL